MSNKLNETISVKELKAKIKKRLDDMSDKLDSQDRMRIALALNLKNVMTIHRYLDKERIEETRNLELAESIANAGDKVLANKNEPADIV